MLTTTVGHDDAIVSGYNIPTFTNGTAFKIVSGEPSLQVLADLQELHAIHDRDFVILHAAWKERENARLKAEAEKATYLPKPENIVLQYRMLHTSEIQGK